MRLPFPNIATEKVPRKGMLRPAPPKVPVAESCVRILPGTVKRPSEPFARHAKLTEDPKLPRLPAGKGDRLIEIDDGKEQRLGQFQKPGQSPHMIGIAGDGIGQDFFFPTIHADPVALIDISSDMPTLVLHVDDENAMC